MKRKLSVAVLILAVIVLVVLWGRTPNAPKPSAPTYSAEPIYAQVEDAGTGKPLAGVVVVAYWALYDGNPNGGAYRPCGAANVEEAVTGEDGRFRLPGWGPWTGGCGAMYSGEPSVYFFKPGYLYQTKFGHLEQDSNMQFLVSTLAKVGWNGQTILLEKYPHGDLRADGEFSNAQNFYELNFRLREFAVDMPGECNWKKVPDMLRALIVQRRAFNAAGNYLDAMDIDLTNDNQSKYMHRFAPQCGYPRDFVEPLEK